MPKVESPSGRVVSLPPDGGKKVVNIYVKDGKLIIEYEKEE